MGDNLVKLIPDAFGTHPLQQGSVRAERLPGSRIDLKAGVDGKQQGSQETEGIFLESCVGYSDRAQNASLKILPPSHVVDDFPAVGILEETIDGEVAAPGVLLGIGEGYAVRMASIKIGAV